MMAGDRLAQLSGLTGVSAAQHLLSIAGAASGSAGALLVAYSGLLTGTAAQHLLVDHLISDGLGVSYQVVRGTRSWDVYVQGRGWVRERAARDWRTE